MREYLKGRLVYWWSTMDDLGQKPYGWVWDAWQWLPLVVAREFVRRVEARAEADMLTGNPLTGAHYRAMRAELAAMEADYPDWREDWRTDAPPSGARADG